MRGPMINSETPWAFFNGADQGEPPLGGIGVVIHISSKRKLLIKYAMGQASNNRVELGALRAALKVALNNQIQDIQMFGDSKIVVDWVKKRYFLKVVILKH